MYTYFYILTYSPSSPITQQMTKPAQHEANTPHTTQKYTPTNTPACTARAYATASVCIQPRTSATTAKTPTSPASKTRRWKSATSLNSFCFCFGSGAGAGSCLRRGGNAVRGSRCGSLCGAVSSSSCCFPCGLVSRSSRCSG